MLFAAACGAAWAADTIAHPRIEDAARHVPGGHAVQSIALSRLGSLAFVGAAIGARRLHHVPASIALAGIGVGIFLGEGN